MRRLCGLLISVGRTGSRRSGYTTAESLSGLTPARVVSYGYDAAWQDKLTSYDNGTTAYTLTYDAGGNREPAELPERLRVHVEPGASAGGGEQERPCGEL